MKPGTVSFNFYSSSALAFERREAAEMPQQLHMKCTIVCSVLVGLSIGFEFCYLSVSFSLYIIFLHPLFSSQSFFYSSFLASSIWTFYTEKVAFSHDYNTHACFMIRKSTFCLMSLSITASQHKKNTTNGVGVAGQHKKINIIIVMSDDFSYCFPRFILLLFYKRSSR